jgi:hypothetical protein
VSPVWYQLRPAPDNSGGVTLTGGHDADQGWISRLREPAAAAAEDCAGEAGSQTCSADSLDPGTLPPLIVPRVVVELPQQETLAMVQDPTATVTVLVTEAVAQGYDGLVSTTAATHLHTHTPL